MFVSYLNTLPTIPCANIDLSLTVRSHRTISTFVTSDGKFLKLNSNPNGLHFTVPLEFILPEYVNISLKESASFGIFISHIHFTVDFSPDELYNTQPNLYISSR